MTAVAAVGRWHLERVTRGVNHRVRNYSQTASAALTEQFGSTTNVNSNATLSGALNVTVNPKHPPKSSATYTALTFRLAHRRLMHVAVCLHGSRRGF